MNRSRYLTLDHWRGVACLAVLLNHGVWERSGSWTERAVAAVAARGWMGVPIFFVISGYCIAAAVDAHRRSPGRPLRTYFLRRLRRIYPPYWAVLLGTMAIVAVVDSAFVAHPLTAGGAFMRPWWFDAWQWIGNLTLTEMWRYHVVAGQKAMILGHAWTLCYEEQFYVVCGLILWLAPRRFFLGAAVVTVAVVCTWLGTTVMNRDIVGFFFDGSWLQFWFGVMVFYVVNHGSRHARMAALAGFVAVAAVMVVNPSRIVDPARNLWQVYLVAALFSAVVLVLQPFDAVIARQRSLSFLRVCGVMCYSLYLVHLPIVNLIRAGFEWTGFPTRPAVSLLACVPASLAVAWWFHVGVERRFLNSRPASTSAPDLSVAAARAVS